MHERFITNAGMGRSNVQMLNNACLSMTDSELDFRGGGTIPLPIKIYYAYYINEFKCYEINK